MSEHHPAVAAHIDHLHAQRERASPHELVGAHVPPLEEVLDRPVFPVERAGRHERVVLGEQVERRRHRRVLFARPEIFYTHGDSLGSPTVLTGRDGRVVERQWFSPFGGRLDESGRDADRGPEILASGFTGHRHEDDFGLIDMQGRFYDPRYRRFVSPDPILGSLGNGQRWNPFSYVMNSPLDYIDPTGFDGEEGAEGYDDGGPEGYDDEPPIVEGGEEEFSWTARAVIPPQEPTDTYWDDSWDQGMVEPTQSGFGGGPAPSDPIELARLAYNGFVEAVTPFGLLERRRPFLTEDEQAAHRAGQTVGDVVGLVGDIAAIGGGFVIGGTGGAVGGLGAAPTAGLSLTVSVASAAAGAAMVTGGLADAAIRIERMTSDGVNPGNAIGAAREQRVAEIFGGRRSGEIIRDPRYGRTDIDVVSGSGDLISVGGAAKARNLSNYIRGLRALQAEAGRRGVQARAALERGTPREVIEAAERVLGAGNVFVF